MPKASCTCGAAYNVPATAIGRRARCKKCGQTFEVRVPEESEGVYSLADLSELERGSDVPVSAVQPSDSVAPPTPAASVADTAWEGVREQLRGSLPSFFAALLRVFLFPARPRNLLTFLVAWVVLTVAPVGCVFLLATGRMRLILLAMVVFVLSEGAFAAFCFNTVRLAAEGEEDLPPLPLTDGIEEAWNQLVVPFFSFIGTVLLALAPAILCRIAIAWGTAAGTIGPTGDLLAVGGLVLLGLLLWPMLVLILVMGDAAALARVGSMAATVARTAVPYGSTVLLVYGAGAVLVFAVVYLVNAGSSGLVILAAAVGARVFSQIVAMRAIGVYYYQFSDRFDWL